MKTKVELKGDVQQSQLKIGDRGYIDGYCRGGNDVPYAAIVVGEVVDLCPLYKLKVIN